MEAIPNRQRKFEFSTKGMVFPESIGLLFQKHAKVFADHPTWWIKGGGARSTLIAFLRRRIEPNVRWLPDSARDIDVLVITKTPGDQEAVARAFGGDVAEQDVEFAETMDKYLRTRDLGINEVALRPERLVCSLKAINDFMSGVVEPSGHEGGPYLRYRIALRGILTANREGLVPARQFIEVAGNASPFDLLIHLFKAYETGTEELYHRVLQQAGHRYALASYTPYEFLNLLLARVYGFYLTEKQEAIFSQAKKDYEQEYYQALSEWEGKYL